MPPRRQSWWQTFPGYMTGAAALIGAVASLLLAINQLKNGRAATTSPASQTLAGPSHIEDSTGVNAGRGRPNPIAQAPTATETAPTLHSTAPEANDGALSSSRSAKEESTPRVANKPVRTTPTVGASAPAASNPQPTNRLAKPDKALQTPRTVEPDAPKVQVPTKLEAEAALRAARAASKSAFDRAAADWLGHWDGVAQTQVTWIGQMARLDPIKKANEPGLDRPLARCNSVRIEGDIRHFTDTRLTFSYVERQTCSGSQSGAFAARIVSCWSDALPDDSGGLALECEAESERRYLNPSSTDWLINVRRSD